MMRGTWSHPSSISGRRFTRWSNATRVSAARPTSSSCTRSSTPPRAWSARAATSSGQELLAGIVDLAKEEYGGLAWTVFSEWGIARSEDFGAIVFALVEEGLLGRQPEDSIHDFEGGIDLRKELEPPPFTGPNRNRRS
jgi:uncharacterized repeat protein (TIGR04138 family)